MVETGGTGETGAPFLPAMVHLGHLVVPDAIVLPAPGREDEDPDLEVVVLGTGKVPEVPDDAPVALHDLFDAGEGVVRPHQGDEEPVVVPGGKEVSRGLLVLELEDDVSPGLQHCRSLSFECADPLEMRGGHHVPPESPWY